MNDCENRPLGEAIRLRLLVHRALDRDDLDSIVESNRLADAAYARLAPMDACRYIEWMQQYKPTPEEVVEMFGCGGDA